MNLKELYDYNSALIYLNRVVRCNGENLEIEIIQMWNDVSKIFPKIRKLQSFEETKLERKNDNFNIFAPLPTQFYNDQVAHKFDEEELKLAITPVLNFWKNDVLYKEFKPKTRKMNAKYG
jgi:hypothetical protein